MPSTKVIKPKPVETKTPERPKPVKVRAVTGAQSELRVPAVRKSRASSCPRCPQRGDRCAQQTAASKTTCETRTRSSSTAPRTAATNRVKHAAVLNPKGPEVSACGPREQRGSVRAETKQIQSHRAFTVIPPNPKKRREIQRKAEAELAALETLRLSRAIAYVSISPSRVGGCMSLEEVRSKQQQEMMQAKRKQKPVKTQLMEETPFLTS